MKPVIRYILIVILAAILIWIFWRLFKGALVVLFLIAIIVFLVYVIIRMKK